MTIRSKALQWYEGKYQRVDKPIYASKLYQPNESWTSSTVWWIEIPITTIENNPESSIHILCQKENDEAEFYHLNIPSDFLQQNLKNLEVNNGRISLFLSAESGNFFVDKRGNKNINFSSFIIKDE